MNRKPELMAPAGHWPQLIAAIENGADAVYFGLNQFSARAKVGFEVNELPQLMETLHARGVKGFITFNTLVFDDEIKQADLLIEKIAEAAADAVIVQDVGMAARIHRRVPGLPIHGSTQMSVTSAQGCELARSLGCSRVVLARELSLADIGRIAKKTDVELETFVHGALCVSYSGQCFSSEAWGGRSANRGQCAQACRLSYELMVDGSQRDTEDARYLLSPGDLFALEQIPELMELGIACLKIEGRYKDENYVALTTAAYRRKIDEAWTKQLGISDDGTIKESLEQVYSRGLEPSFIKGVNHQAVVRGRAPRHRGVQIGKVARVNRDSVVIAPLRSLKSPIKAGDGIVFDAADWRSPDEPEEGGAVFGLELQPDGNVVVEFGKESINLARVRSGDWVWRTRDPKLLRKIKSLARPHKVLRTKPVSFSVRAELGKVLEVTAHLDCSLENLEPVRVLGETKLAKAKQQSLSSAALREQLGRLGGSFFHLGDFEFAIDGLEKELFLPISELNSIRRKCVEAILTQRRLRNQSYAVLDDKTHIDAKRPRKDFGAIRPSVSRLHVLVRSRDQLDAVLPLRPDSITLDYLELYGLRPSVERIQSANVVARVASPRVLKPSEQNVIQFLLSLDCEILVRSAGLLHELLALEQAPRIIGDFSLNIANQVSADYFLARGVDIITPTYDLNASQVSVLARLVGPDHVEAIAYSHLPVFHTEHCVFCRFLSEGTDHTNCGHPCEKHRVALRDQQGREHPVMADVGCRNTVFGAEAQVPGKYLRQWFKDGVRNFRVEFVHETAKQVKEITQAFLDAFEQPAKLDRLEQTLNTLAPSGTGSGSYFVPLEKIAVPAKRSNP